MRKLLKVPIVGLAIMVVVSLVISCAPAAPPVAPPVTPPVTPPPAVAEEVELIPIGLSMGLTGAVASVTMPESYASLDYLTWVNDQGGFEYTGPDGKVHKAKYEIMWADNGFLISRSISIANRFIGKGCRIIITA